MKTLMSRTKEKLKEELHLVYSSEEGVTTRTGVPYEDLAVAYGLPDIEEATLVDVLEALKENGVRRLVIEIRD